MVAHGLQKHGREARLLLFRRLLFRAENRVIRMVEQEVGKNLPIARPHLEGLIRIKEPELTKIKDSLDFCPVPDLIPAPSPISLGDSVSV